MTNKLQKYREERERNTSKIALLTERNASLDQKIAELENLEIRAVLRSENVTVDQLIAMFRSLRQGQNPVQPAVAPAEERVSEPTDDDDLHPYAPYPATEEENTEDDNDEDE